MFYERLELVENKKQIILLVMTMDYLINCPLKSGNLMKIKQPTFSY